jgi:hypothetical protein
MDRNTPDGRIQKKSSPEEAPSASRIGEQDIRPLGYATGSTPMLRPPFPSPQLAAWVMLALTVVSTTGGTVGLIWIIRTIADSDQPIGAFACVPVPLLLMIGTMLGMIFGTIGAFRRAYARSKRTGPDERTM